MATSSRFPSGFTLRGKTSARKETHLKEKKKKKKY